MPPAIGLPASRNAGRLYAVKENAPLNIGFVSTRFAGLDGVSLETTKWEQVLERLGHRVFWFAGELDRDPARSVAVPEAFFNHPDNLELSLQLFGRVARDRAITDRIAGLKESLKDHLYRFIGEFAIDLLVVENALAIPMQVPLGIALAELIAETAIPTIAHHHDFYWERPRFLVNSIGDILQQAFPPDIPSIRHVTINSVAARDLASRRGLSSTIIYNVIDFDQSATVDEFNRDFRKDFGFSDDDLLVLQPTRVVSRKGIEQALYLVKRLDLPNVEFIISHSPGDESSDYYDWVRETAEQQGIRIHFLHNRFDDRRRFGPDGEKLYSLWDVYPHADLITYPSLYEGFGNAFLEAVFFRKPILVNRYSVYVVDIAPKGFDMIEIDGFLTQKAVDRVREVLLDPQKRAEMVEKNFALARRHFSYDVLRRRLESVLSSFYGA